MQQFVSAEIQITMVRAAIGFGVRRRFWSLSTALQVVPTNPLQLPTFPQSLLRWRPYLAAVRWQFAKRDNFLTGKKAVDIHRFLFYNESGGMKGFKFRFRGFCCLVRAILRGKAGIIFKEGKLSQSGSQGSSRCFGIRLQLLRAEPAGSAKRLRRSLKSKELKWS